MHSRSRSIIMSALLSLLLQMAGAATAATEVVVDGVGSDREAALRDAQRNAVSTVVGQVVDSRTLVANYNLVSDRILTSSQGYLKTFQVVEEGGSPAGYRVRIRAVVETASIRNDVNAIKVLSAKQGNPRFIVMPDPSPAADAFRPGDPIVGQAASGVQGLLVGRQLEVIQAPAYNVATGLSSPAAMSDLSMWGAGIGAEYVVYYSVIGFKEAGGRTFQKATAVVNLTVVHTGSYKVIAQAEGRGLGTDQNEQLAYRAAGKIAGENAMSKALDQVLASWSNTGTTGGTAITLTIENVPGNTLQEFEEALQRSGSVNQVSRRSFADGTATLQVTLEGNSFDLGEAVGQVMSEKGWKWALTGSDGSSIKYRVPNEVSLLDD